jgi:hypothetical protein
MSKKLALSSALSIAMMTLFALFGQSAAASHAPASGKAEFIDVSAVMVR